MNMNMIVAASMMRLIVFFYCCCLTITARRQRQLPLSSILLRHNTTRQRQQQQQHRPSDDNVLMTMRMTSVPRGGGGNAEGDDVAKDFYYQELSEQLLHSDDDNIEKDLLESSSSSDDNRDVERSATSSETDDCDDGPLDPILYDPAAQQQLQQPLRMIPRLLFLSPHLHLTKTLPSTMIHIAALVIQAAKRSLIAGARAIFVDDEEEEIEGGDRRRRHRPVVRTLVGKSVFVLGEMYHAAKSTGSATSPSSSSEEDVQEEENGDDEEINGRRSASTIGSSKHHRRRRRRRRVVETTATTGGSPSHHHHRNEARYTTSPTAVVCNGGGIEPRNNNQVALLNLARQHNINLIPSSTTTEENEGEKNFLLSKKYVDSILLNSQTSLSMALQKSNLDARFLICFISSNNRKKKGTTTTTTTKSADSIALSSLLSPEVIKFINRRPLGKKQSDNTGSYYIWIMNSGGGDDDSSSSLAKEIDLAMKRLKVKPPTSSSSTKTTKKKEDGPILAIIYPATTIDKSTGKLKVTPKLLAQHHCHPPPSSPDVMMAWVNTIRKRHIREFAKLQHDRREIMLLKERNEGYKESMREDMARAEREERELRDKKENEERERSRLEKIELRRQELLKSLPDEPEVKEEAGRNSNSEGIITIALRFTNGSRDQRRFVAKKTSMNDVFNWVDAMHGLEREKIELSTMNGSKTFVYVEEGEEEEEAENSRRNLTLDEAGLGKMTALRVLEIVGDAADADNEGDEESKSSDE